jgi:hypothetical protein
MLSYLSSGCGGDCGTINVDECKGSCQQDQVELAGKPVVFMKDPMTVIGPNDDVLARGKL